MAELTISVSEMKNHFDEYMQRIKSGEVIVITKYVKPIAQFMPAQKIQKEHKSPHPRAKKRGVKAESF